MQVTQLSESRFSAREKWLEYARSVRLRKRLGHSDEAAQRQLAEDDALRAAYLELARGRKVLQITQVLGEAGLDERRLPRLAIARIDWPQVWFSFRGTFYWTPQSWLTRGERLEAVALGRGALAAGRSHRELEAVSARSMVPIVPPQFRPATARGYYILFEPVWQRVPDPDPILLRRLPGGFFAVLAQWDMTPVERAVLFGR